MIWFRFLKEVFNFDFIDFDFWFCSKKKPILRPPISTHITCSIHCPNASGYPQLLCVACQSLYHPACVGLGPTTGKSLTEALIFASTNPQYDDRLFIELQVQYMKIPSSEHGENMLCTEIVFDIQNNFCTQHVLPHVLQK